MAIFGGAYSGHAYWGGAYWGTGVTGPVIIPPGPPPGGSIALITFPVQERLELILQDLLDAVQYRLGDPSGLIWRRDEIREYAIDGYNALCMETGCLWDTDVLPDWAYAFNCTSSYELRTFVGGEVIEGMAQYTAEFERDYVNNLNGPANHNYHWEANEGWVDQLLPAAVVDLTEELYEIERATWNSSLIAPLRSRELEQSESRYELNRGQVEAYTQDKDGLRRLRKWRVPAAAYVPYPMDRTITTVSGGTGGGSSGFFADSYFGKAYFGNSYWSSFGGTGLVTTTTIQGSELFGILVDISDITDQVAEGTWGDFVQVPGQPMMSDTWGIIVAIYKETNNVRLEFRRRPFAMRDDDRFEIPNYHVVYLRHYVLARALEREGDGQDLTLAAHYQARYEACVARMMRRKGAMHFQQQYVMGGSAGKARKKPLARLPWQYGRPVR